MPATPRPAPLVKALSSEHAETLKRLGCTPETIAQLDGACSVAIAGGGAPTSAERAKRLTDAAKHAASLLAAIEALDLRSYFEISMHLGYRPSDDEVVVKGPGEPVFSIEQQLRTLAAALGTVLDTLPGKGRRTGRRRTSGGQVALVALIAYWLERDGIQVGRNKAFMEACCCCFEAAGVMVDPTAAVRQYIAERGRGEKSL